MATALILISVKAGAPVFTAQEREQLAVDQTARRILEVNPKLQDSYAAEVAAQIHAAAKKHDLKVDKLFAIIAQESKFRVGAVNKRSHDYGIGQINIKNIDALKLDRHRLLTDVAYSVNWSAYMLAHFKRYEKRGDKNWWTRYNSSNPTKRAEYGILVAQYM